MALVSKLTLLYNSLLYRASLETFIGPFSMYMFLLLFVLHVLFNQRIYGHHPQVNIENIENKGNIENIENP